MRDIDLIVVHCSDTPATMDIGATEIREWHINGNGWKDIGYHYVIRRDGRIEHGRMVDEVGAHVAGHNASSIGVCLVGGKGPAREPEANFMPEQYSSLLCALRMFRRLWPEARIVGHRDLNPGKACPCFDVAKWLAQQGIE